MLMLANQTTGACVQPQRTQRVAAMLRNLTAQEMALRLRLQGLDELFELRARGELIAVKPTGRPLGYPAFQAAPAIQGEPLREMLKPFGAGNQALAYDFLTHPAIELANLLPVEVLLGRRLFDGKTSDRQAALVQAGATQRFNQAAACARVFLKQHACSSEQGGSHGSQHRH